MFQLSAPILERDARHDINVLYDSLKVVDISEEYGKEFRVSTSLRDLQLKDFFDDNEPFAKACLEKVLDDGVLELQFSELNDKKERSYYFGKYWLIRGEGDAIQGFAGVLKPISIDSYYESKLKELSEELNRKIRELQNINFATSHRIRSPLARILGLIEILKIENKYDPYMAMLEECSKELDEEIRQFSQRLEKEKSPNK